MSPSATLRFPVEDGVSLAVDTWEPSETGQGVDPAAAFLLVHGLASNSRLWWGSAERLAALGHAVASVDQRGHGRSDKPATGYTLEQACADLMRVVARLRADEAGPEDGRGFGRRLIVAGQSWGANVALELGYRHPDVFNGVVCVDGGTIELSSRFPDWESCSAVMAPPRTIGRPAADIEAFMARTHADWPASGRFAQMANFEIRADGTVAPWLSFENHMALLRALWEHRPSTRYPDITVPVLFVPAENMGQVRWTADKRAAVDEAVAAIPRAAAHWFSPADHDIHAQFPVELADLLHHESTEGILA